MRGGSKGSIAVGLPTRDPGTVLRKWLWLLLHSGRRLSRLSQYRAFGEASNADRFAQPVVFSG